MLLVVHSCLTNKTPSHHQQHTQMSYVNLPNSYELLLVPEGLKKYEIILYIYRHHITYHSSHIISSHITSHHSSHISTPHNKAQNNMNQLL